jgi:predicted regulator of Ras-like GTPase activity (Roadblock/LC7/MglB family)
MTIDVPASDRTDPSWLLGGLVDRVPGARCAVLLSADGLVIAEHELGQDAADQMAPLAAGLCSIARTVGVRFGGGDGVRQLVAELDAALLSVSSAGYNSVLAVLADRDADAGVLGYEMAQLVRSVAPFLAAQPRIRGAVTRHQAAGAATSAAPPPP